MAHIKTRSGDSLHKTCARWLLIQTPTLSIHCPIHGTLELSEHMQTFSHKFLRFSTPRDGHDFDGMVTAARNFLSLAYRPDAASYALTLVTLAPVDSSR